MSVPRRALLAFAIAALGTGALLAQWFPRDRGPVASDLPKEGEFHFLRVEYSDMYNRGGFGRGRGWWMQDWPAADIHFSQGLARLTRFSVGDYVHMRFTDKRIYDYPWIYSTQNGYWNLNDEETAALHDYLERGGFLMTDDFHGPQDWEVFAETMDRVYPGQPIDDIPADHPMLHVTYDIKERTFIPGTRHLRMGPGGKMIAVPPYTPPYWRALYDSKQRLVVAVNFNQDVGDAWEFADDPMYPEEMTRLAYYFGINYLMYSITH